MKSKRIIPSRKRVVIGNWPQYSLNRPRWREKGECFDRIQGNLMGSFRAGSDPPAFGYIIFLHHRRREERVQRHTGVSAKGFWGYLLSRQHHRLPHLPPNKKGIAPRRQLSETCFIIITVGRGQLTGQIGPSGCRAGMTIGRERMRRVYPVLLNHGSINATAISDGVFTFTKWKRSGFHHVHQ